MSKVKVPWTKSEEYHMCQTKAAQTLPPQKIRSNEVEALKQTKRLHAGLTATMHTVKILKSPLARQFKMTNECRADVWRICSSTPTATTWTPLPISRA